MGGATHMFILMLCIATFVASEDVPFSRTSYVAYLDPCKAEGFMVDAALTHEQYRATKQMALKLETNASIFEMSAENKVTKRDVDSVFREIQKVRTLLSNELRQKWENLGEFGEQESEGACWENLDKLKGEILDIRIKWMRYKSNFKRAQKMQLAATQQRSRNSLFDTPNEVSQNLTEANLIDESVNETVSIKRMPRIKLSRIKRGAIKNKKKLWQNGVIPYTVANMHSASNKILFKLAMELWERDTCLVFKEKEPTDKDHIVFTAGRCGCCSFIGRGGGAQAISIGEGCNKLGIVAHELGHVIGFHHEHVRPDREDYVQIIYNNIQQGESYNFNVHEDIDSLNETYDFSSIMHYSGSQFASDSSLNTIIPHRKPGVLVPPTIGQRVAPSAGDIRQVNKLYGCASCGRTLLEPEDNFSYNPEVGTAALCQWRILNSPGERVELTVTDLDIPVSENCQSDYLEVRDGHHFKSPLLGRFCGNSASDSLLSTANMMWLEFKSSNGSGKGFRAVYESVCGGDLIKEEGFLTSPDFPENYPSRKLCIWVITVPNNFFVALSFEFFDLESRPRCDRDYLEIRDGPAEDSPLITKLCGSRKPRNIQTTGRHMFVKFVSSAFIQKSGFSATFVKEIDECETDWHGCEHVCVNSMGSYHCACRLNYQLHSNGKWCEPACGGLLEELNGTISSPSFPEIYPENRKCVWQISAPEGYEIHLNFSHFDLEGQGQSCDYDYLHIFSGVNDRIGAFCGYLLPAPIIVTNSLRIEFYSDATIQNTGFSAAYIADTDECLVANGGCQHSCLNTVGSFLCTCDSGFLLDADRRHCKVEKCHTMLTRKQGSITSKNYPNNYPSRQNCDWHISTAPGHRIVLRFLHVDLEPHQTCIYDHIAVYDGDSTEARSLAKLCGQVLEQTDIESTGNNLFLTFISDAAVERTGFHIEYEAICGANLWATEAEQVFVSHVGYGRSNYPIDRECEWLIQAEPGRLIQLRFTDFELESSADCDYDSVIVYAGLDVSDPVIGQFCGLELPDIVYSSSEYLLVIFSSDQSIIRKGFSAKYKMVAL